MEKSTNKYCLEICNHYIVFTAHLHVKDFLYILFPMKKGSVDRQWLHPNTWSLIPCKVAEIANASYAK